MSVVLEAVQTLQERVDSLGMESVDTEVSLGIVFGDPVDIARKVLSGYVPDMEVEQLLVVVADLTDSVLTGVRINPDRTEQEGQTLVMLCQAVALGAVIERKRSAAEWTFEGLTQDELRSALDHARLNGWES